MSLTVYSELEQGTPEWLAARCGLVTASVVGKLITPATLKVASNDTSRDLTNTLVAERITGYVDPIYANADMARGNWDEPFARDVYAEHYAPVEQVGFMVKDFGEYKIGFSPDGLVGDDGLIEIKSRKPKIQLVTLLADQVPMSNMAQMQCGMLVSGREWCDYVSFSGGMPLYVKRVYPDPAWHQAIKEAVYRLEAAASQSIGTYASAIKGRPMTERTEKELEIVF